MNILSRFLDLNQKEIDRFAKIVKQVNALEDDYKKLKELVLLKI